MTLWDNFRRKLTAIIDMPIEAVQGQHPRLAPSGVTPSAHYSYPIKPPQQAPKSRLLREAAGSYSHGLEKIYALETVDPRTIRVMGNPSTSEEQKTKVNHQPGEFSFELDFGTGFRDWITPCFLQEPIQVLGLSSQAEKNLLQQGWKTFKDLLSVDRTSLVHLKGFGQGHIDELNQKISAYIGSRSRHYSRTIQWDAWLRSLLSHLPIKEAKIVAESFSFDHAVAVPPHLSAEIRRMKPAERSAIYQRALKAMQEGPAQQEARVRWNEILNAFIYPWAGLRDGIVSDEEIFERVLCCSEGSIEGVKFLKTLLGENDFFGDRLVEVESGLYALYPQHYQSILEAASSYYYKATVYYSVEELTSLVYRQLVKNWTDCSMEEIRKVLLNSGNFRTFREASRLCIALSFYAA